MDSSPKLTDEVVQQIMITHKSLPARPALDEVEAAKSLIQNVEKEEQSRLEAISKQTKSSAVPEELFKILQEMQKNLVYFQGKDQKREAQKLLDLENLHMMFDELILRASRCISSPSSSSADTHHYDYPNASASTVSSVNLFATTGSDPHQFKSSSMISPGLYDSDKEPVKSSQLFSKDDSYVDKAKPTFRTWGEPIVLSKPQIVHPSLKPSTASGQQGEKLSLIMLASLFEISSKKGTPDLNLQNKLMEQIDWLPDSIGKLSSLITLDLSENRIVALPFTVGGLSSLKKLDLHSNRISEFPNSIGDLLNLVFLDIRGNQLTTLPTTFGRLVRLQELDLSSNRLSFLPGLIGSLISLKRLDVEMNNIEEIPHTIGQCSSLKELRADYNRLKAIPEAVGRINSLEVISVRYNNIKQLPTTMASLSRLRELNVSFNELESLPESLCFATALVKLNVGNNFANLQSLPTSIGNLEMLEELDISNNQIRVLPVSFRGLRNLRVLHTEENPLDVPPRQVAEGGARAVVLYMEELVACRNVKSQPVNQRRRWSRVFCFSSSNRREQRFEPFFQRNAGETQNHWVEAEER